MGPKKRIPADVQQFFNLEAKESSRTVDSDEMSDDEMERLINDPDTLSLATNSKSAGKVKAVKRAKKAIINIVESDGTKTPDTIVLSSSEETQPEGKWVWASESMVKKAGRKRKPDTVDGGEPIKKKGSGDELLKMKDDILPPPPLPSAPKMLDLINPIDGDKFQKTKLSIEMLGKTQWRVIYNEDQKPLVVTIKKALATGFLDSKRRWSMVNRQFEGDAIGYQIKAMRIGKLAEIYQAIEAAAALKCQIPVQNRTSTSLYIRCLAGTEQSDTNFYEEDGKQLTFEETGEEQKRGRIQHSTLFQHAYRQRDTHRKRCWEARTCHC